MKARPIICAAILTVIVVSWAQAQQSPFSTVPRPAPSTPPGTGYTPTPQLGIPQQAPAPRPLSQPYTQRIPGEVPNQDPTEPHYPYPPYPNPFYDGSTTPQNTLAGGMDWLRELPSNVVQRFSTFVDTHLFPKRAATHGAATCESPAPPAAGQTLPRPFTPQVPQPQAPQPQGPDTPLSGLLPSTR